jgi:hypothetical protein
MSVTLVNNSPQLTVATAGTRGLTGAHVVSAAFSGSNLILTGTNSEIVTTINGVGTYSISFDFSDIAKNYLDGVIINLDITS